MLWISLWPSSWQVQREPVKTSGPCPNSAPPHEWSLLHTCLVHAPLTPPPSLLAANLWPPLRAWSSRSLQSTGCLCASLHHWVLCSTAAPRSPGLQNGTIWQPQIHPHDTPLSHPPTTSHWAAWGMRSDSCYKSPTSPNRWPSWRFLSFQPSHKAVLQNSPIKSSPIKLTFTRPSVELHAINNSGHYLQRSGQAEGSVCQLQEQKIVLPFAFKASECGCSLGCIIAFLIVLSALTEKNLIQTESHDFPACSGEHSQPLTESCSSLWGKLQLRSCQVWGQSNSFCGFNHDPCFEERKLAHS